MKLRPTKDETQEQFLARATAEVLKNDLQPGQAPAVAEEVAKAIWNHRGRILNSAEEFPKRVQIRHLEPGLVNYEYLNQGKGMTILVTRPFMDSMRKSLENKPIINERHKDMTPQEIRDIFKNGEADGVIVSAFNSAEDGWDWVNTIVWDEATVQNILNGYSASCQYEVTAWQPGGVYHNIPYEREAVAGVYEHIAIVKKGRYDGVDGVRIILMNSKEGGSTMKLKFWPFNKETKEKAVNALEMDSEKATIEVDGKDVPLHEAVAAYTEKAKNDAAAAEALKNAAPKLSDADTVQIGEGTVSVADLKAAFVAQQAVKAKNESDAAMKKAHEDGDHKDKDMENCPMCNTARNEKEAEEKAKKDAEEKEKAANAAAALDEKARAANRMPDFKEPETLQERAARGREMYGSAKAA